MIIAIRYDQDLNSQFQLANSADYLLGLKKINIFVGTNNSGKSRFLRSHFLDNGQQHIYLHENFDINLFNGRIYPTLNQHLKGAINVAKAHSAELIKSENLFDSSINAIPQNDIQKALEIINLCKTISTNDFQNLVSRDEVIINSVLNQFKSVYENRPNTLSSLFKNDASEKLYIPVLRGLRPIQMVEKNAFTNTDAYLERTVFDYKVENILKENIYTGLSIYEDVMKLLLGTEDDRKQITEFEAFLSQFVFSEKITLIPKYKEDVLHIKKGESKQHEIYNLGDGLQTIIAILFPVFMRRHKETRVFIEEPEVHLHPDWQIKLLNALKQFDKHQYFISTHSASFINDSESSIYSIKKENEKSVISFTNLDDKKAEIIYELGYKPSDLFLTNYILWVEGPSDKIYFNYWIKKLAPELRQGFHFSLMTYYGENYKYLMKDGDEFSLTFVKNINQNFGIVLDSDRKNPSEKYPEDKKRIKSIFLNNNSFCWLTKFREIENYIPFSTFEKAVKAVHKKNILIPTGNYDDRNTVIDLDSTGGYKSRIKLPEHVFSQIQKNKNGSTKSISARVLRNAIEQALSETRKKFISINKVKVAKEVVKLNPEIEETELKKKLNKLIQAIRQANSV